MKLRDFKIGMRLLLKAPGYSVVVISGLAVGIAVFFMLSMLVMYAFSYNSHIPNREDVFAVKYLNVQYGPFARWRTYSPLIIRDIVSKSGLPIEATGTIKQNVTIRTNTEEFEEQILLADSNFAKIFNVNPLIGDVTSALTNPSQIAITLSMSRKLFGDASPLWKTIEISKQTFQVVAILPDVPNNATEKYQILAGFGSSAWEEEERSNALNQWSSAVGTNYIRLSKGTQPESIVSFLQNRADSSPDNELSSEEQVQFGVKHAIQLKLVNLKEIYFDDDLPKDSSLASRSTVLGLLSISLLILFLASSNYVTLASLRTLERQKEIALRKVLGVKEFVIASQFLFESVFFSFMAGLVGIILVILLLPSFSLLLGLELAEFSNVENYVKACLFSCFLGLLTSVYPTYLALKVLPRSALLVTNDSENRSGYWFRKTLTILQFTSALGLASICALIGLQTYYATTIHPGYDIDNLYILEIKSKESGELVRNFDERVRQLQNVEGVSSAIDSYSKPIRSTGAFKVNGKSQVNLEYSNITANFFQVHGIQPVAGRLFDSKIDQSTGVPLIVINEVAAKNLGFVNVQDAVNQFVEFGGTSRQVIGVVPNIIHATLKTGPVSMAYLLGKSKMGLAIRIKGDVNLTKQRIENIWSEIFPNATFTFNSARSIFANKYRSDLKLVQIFASAGIIALLISTFGIYVLTAFNVERRSKEIILRKLFGADKRSIFRLLFIEFAFFLAICGILSMPLAWLYGQRFLAEYVDLAPYLNLAFPVVFLLMSFIAFLAIIRHTLKAMNMPPAEILKR